MEEQYLDVNDKADGTIRRSYSRIGLGALLMKMRMVSIFALAVVGLGQVWAAESGFLDDYSMLESRSGDAIDRAYIAPNTMELLAGYDSVMVDQPEVFLAADTKYKGAKPDALKSLADTLRTTLNDQLQAGGYKSVEAPGPGVIYMRWAITDLYLKKKKRGLLSYTPAGFVVNAAVKAATKDLWKKIDIVEMSIEAEFIDSESGAVLAAVMLERGARKTKQQKRELVSWEELDATMQTFGARLVCNLDNARKSVDQRSDCTLIEVEVTTDS